MNFWFLFCFSLQVQVGNAFFQRSSSSLWKQLSLLFRHHLCCWWKHVAWRDWLIDSKVKTNARHVTDKSHADCPGMSLYDRSYLVQRTIPDDTLFRSAVCGSRDVFLQSQTIQENKMGKFSGFTSILTEWTVKRVRLFILLISWGKVSAS